MVENIRELEDIAKALPISGEMLLLCQYPLESFSGMVAMMAVETYGYTIYNGDLMGSAYFKKKILTA